VGSERERLRAGESHGCSLTAGNVALDPAIIYLMRQASGWATILLAGGLSQIGEFRDV